MISNTQIYGKRRSLALIKNIIVLIIIAGAFTSCFSQTPRSGISGSYLIKTAWGGSAPFNEYSPGNSELGCHAIAFAQILYFHRLAPFGKIDYQCSNGKTLSENVEYTPEWDIFALDQESATKDTTKMRKTARFLYYVALVVRKDFGTNQYINYPKDFHKQAIESHFNCTLNAIVKNIHSSFYTALKEEPGFYSQIQNEIDSMRPLGFYYTDRTGGGHAVVIDGYTLQDDKMYVHVNFGWFGRSNGWYLLEKDLPPNVKEIALITLTPLYTQ
ncbi:hypothetical protein GF407_03440 [candidate division KSB1 bacterium]|nr:hypothetical protein [candidate division KSB1 bacterium]